MKTIKFTYGSSYYVNEQSAERFYGQNYREAMRDGSISIGKPPLKDDEELSGHHVDGRYLVNVLSQ